MDISCQGGDVMSSLKPVRCLAASFSVDIIEQNVIICFFKGCLNENSTNLIYQLFSITNLTDFSKCILILIMMPIMRFKQVWTGAKKTGKVIECSENCCLENSKGKRLNGNR